MGRKRRENLRRSRKMNRLRRRRNHIYFRVLLGSLLILSALLVSVISYFLTHVKLQYTVEAGGKISAGDFWNGFLGKAEFTDNASEVNTAVPGTYKMKLKVGFVPVISKITVKDTVPPKAEAVDKQIEYGGNCDISAFVTNIEDATKVTLTYKNAPDFKQTGKQEIIIILEDLGGNKTEITAGLFVPNVRSLVQIETGQDMVTADAFLVHEGTAEFVSDISNLDLTKTGDISLQVMADGEIYDVVLRIRDQVPPQGKAVPVTGRTGKRIEADKFVTDIVDETSVSVSYKNEPDFNLEGEQAVVLVLTDQGGNITELEGRLTLVKDTEPPVISGDAITVTVGGSVSYKKSITVTDNYDSPEEITLKIDNSSVNLKQIGTYVVHCTATDTSGNKAEKDISITVVSNDSANVDEAAVNQLADKILGLIIDDGMSQYDKAHAIYLWITDNLGYITHSEKMSWTQGEYEGLQNREGDCFVFAATSKILLTRAGIQNMDITKSTSKPRSHYWNLVNVGEGWYHFDTTPRSDNDNFFMATDAKVKAYSDSHSGSHAFDRSLYPKIN